MANITLQGNACTTNGDLPQAGTAAPDFTWSMRNWPMSAWQISPARKNS